jgi:arylsulfatase A-like enzyme
MKLTFIFIIIFFFINGSNLSAQNKDNEKPNVVFIICDDLNDAVHGMGGHPQAKTPNLDKLMTKGVRFTNAQSNSPICGPSRASLWSGLYPQTTGYYGYNQQENHWRNNHVLKNSVTLFEHLAGNGYQVYATGKIHHNGHEDYTIFENSDGTNGFKVEPSFGPYPWDGDPAKTNEKIRGIPHPDMHPALQNKWDGYGPIRDLSNDLDGGRWLYTHNGGEFKIKDQKNRDLTPDERSAEYAIDVINKKHDKPFFLSIGFNRPHSPLYAPQKYFDMFPLDSLRLAPYRENDLEDCAESLWKNKKRDVAGTGFHKYNTFNNAGGKDLLLEWTQAYLACVAFVDDQIGKIVEAIEKSEHGDNTLIVVTSDHGFHMGEKEYLFKNSLWEESARIPLVVSGLNISEGKECHQPVSLIDMYPTIVDVCGLPRNPNSGGNNKKLDGFSIMPLAENPSAGKWDGNNYAITAVASAEKLEKDEAGAIDQQHYSIRTERYRYIICRNGEEELYDHYYDTYEWFNLANDSLYADIVEKLRKKSPYPNKK